MMSWIGNFLRRLFRREKPRPQETQRVKREEAQIPWKRLAALLAPEQKPDKRPKLQTAKPGAGVVPKADLAQVLACDATPYDELNSSSMFGDYVFPGYPYLAELAQVPEYRKMGATLAEEMIREGIEFRTKGEGDAKLDRIRDLQDWFTRHNVLRTCAAAIERDAWFGRCQIYLDVTKPNGKQLVSDDAVELSTPLSLNAKKIGKGCFKSLRVIEPTWSYPGIYNSTDPLKANYYRPETWYVMGKTVHASRLLMVCSTPVPDMLKAAYSFGGLSLSQMAQPYVNNWLRTRQAVSDIVSNFSVNGIKTPLQTQLQSPLGQSQLFDRMQFYNAVKNNRGMMLLDKEQEEFFQVNTPLSTLDALQAQSQEHMSSVSSIPLVKLFGIQPSGLNASSDGEIRVFYDFIASRQQRDLRPLLEVMTKIAQLDLYGDVDDDIVFVFMPLYQLSEVEEAAAHKTEADTDAVYVQAGAISSLDVRKKLANDPNSGYAGLDVSEDDEDEPDADPESEQAPEEEGEPQNNRDTRSVAGDSAERRHRGVVSPKTARRNQRHA